MGFLSDLFSKPDSNLEEPASVSGNTVEMHGISGDLNILDLEKGDILDLTKYSDSLNKIRASAGWKVNRGGKDYDLDLCAFLMNKHGKIKDIVYYSDKKSTGIYLDEDNLTGSNGKQDDENIYVSLDKIPDDIKTIYFGVVIYRAKARKQAFMHVKNAYIRLVDESNGREICRFRLTEDGGNNTAVIAAKLYRNGNGWEFSGIGEYSKNTISSLGKAIEMQEVIYNGN